jgi:hypothetical protein
MLCFCACEEPTRKYQVTTDAAAPDAALWRTFSMTLGEADIVVVRAEVPKRRISDFLPLVVNVRFTPEPDLPS